MDLARLGRVLLVMGMALALLGLGLMGKLPFLGRLPGDIRIERGNFVLYIPIASMLIVSLLLSLALWLLRR